MSENEYTPQLTVKRLRCAETINTWNKSKIRTHHLLILALHCEWPPEIIPRSLGSLTSVVQCLLSSQSSSAWYCRVYILCCLRSQLRNLSPKAQNWEVGLALARTAIYVGIGKFFSGFVLGCPGNMSILTGVCGPCCGRKRSIWKWIENGNSKEKPECRNTSGALVRTPVDEPYECLYWAHTSYANGGSRLKGAIKNVHQLCRPCMKAQLGKWRCFAAIKLCSESRDDS